MFGPAVAVTHPFVVVRGGEALEPRTIADHHEGDLGSLEALLDENPIGGGAETAGDKELVQGRLEIVLGGDDENTLAGGQSVGLEDHRKTEAPRRPRGVVRGSHDFGGGGGDPMPEAEFLGEDLARLELGGGGHGSEEAQPATGEDIADAVGQGHLGSDHGEIDGELGRGIGQRLEIADVEDRESPPWPAIPGLPGATKSASTEGELANGVDHGVLAGAGTENEDAHGLSPGPGAGSGRSVWTISAAEQPRLRSLAGFARPCMSGPRARAPPRRSTAL